MFFFFISTHQGLHRLGTFYRKERKRKRGAGEGSEGGDEDAGTKLSRTSVNKRAKLTFQFLRLVAK